MPIAQKQPQNHLTPSAAAELAQGYEKSYRILEILSIAVFFILQGLLFSALFPFYVSAGWILPTLILLGLIAADFVSGIVHWAGDTWGSVDWPIIGKSLIRPFREHHVDQRALTQHDFVELNGSNCLVSIPVLLFAVLVVWLPLDSFWADFGVAFLAWMTLWVFFTNMFHQWAHREPHENNLLIRSLQRARLILSAETHAVHHVAPHLDYYCITTGWLNAPLKRTGFFRYSEKFISAVTGALPRA